MLNSNVGFFFISQGSTKIPPSLNPHLGNVSNVAPIMCKTPLNGGEKKTVWAQIVAHEQYIAHPK